MRTLTAFLLTLLLLIGGGVAIDAVLTQRAERLASQVLAEQLGADVDVRFGTWPVTLHLLGGSLPEARVRMAEVPAGDVTFALVVADLRRVSIDGAAALAFGLGDPPARMVLEAREGRLEADLDARAVSELTGATVQLTGGRATIGSGQRATDAVAGLERGAVVLRPVGDVPEGAEAVRFEVPPLPGGARPARVQLREDALRLIADVRRLGG